MCQAAWFDNRDTLFKEVELQDSMCAARGKGCGKKGEIGKSREIDSTIPSRNDLIDFGVKSRLKVETIKRKDFSEPSPTDRPNMPKH